MMSIRGRRWISVSLCALSVGLARGEPLNLDLSPADVERALTLARGREPERARFHAPYIITLQQPTVQTIEIVSEFRRVVLIAEEHIGRGDRMFAFSARLAQAAVLPWKQRVSVVARLQFHPLNTYIHVPRIDIALDGPSAEAALVDTVKNAVPPLAPAPPGQGQPILGALVEAIFNATLVGQTRRTVIVSMEGRELTRVSVDFAALQ